MLAPIAWVIGVPWQDATTVGSLIGQKIVINEFVAYLQLADIVNGKVPGVVLTEQGKLIATYALCGFANFSSIAIQIGGIGGLAPERRGDLARFGLRAVLGGSIATFMTATIAGVLTYLGILTATAMSDVVVVGSFNVDHVWHCETLPHPGETLAGTVCERSRRQGLQPGGRLRARGRDDHLRVRARRRRGAANSHAPWPKPTASISSTSAANCRPARPASTSMAGPQQRS